MLILWEDWRRIFVNIILQFGLIQGNPLSDEIHAIFRKLAKADKYSPERKIDLIIRDVEFRCNKLKEEDEERQRKLDAPESKFDVWLAFLKIGEYKKGKELLDKLKYLKSTIKDPELCLDEIMLELITLVDEE
jgi:hypothetical protein